MDFEFNCKDESVDYCKSAREHEKDLDKAHALLWGRCQLTLRERIDSQNGFEETITNDTIGLPMAIKKCALNYEDLRSWAPVASDTPRAFFNCKKRNDDSLSECTRCFK